MFILNLVGPQSDIEAQHFTPVDTTENVYYYLVESGDVDGMPLETGDEIAMTVSLCGCWIFQWSTAFCSTILGQPRMGKKVLQKGAPFL